MASEFERNVIKTLTCLVPGQKSSLVDGEGHRWTSTCRVLKLPGQETDNILYTEVVRDGQVVYSELFDCETNEMRTQKDVLGVKAKKEV